MRRLSGGLIGHGLELARDVGLAAVALDGEVVDPASEADPALDVAFLETEDCEAAEPRDLVSGLAVSGERLSRGRGRAQSQGALGDLQLLRGAPCGRGITAQAQGV